MMRNVAMSDYDLQRVLRALAARRREERDEKQKHGLDLLIESLQAQDVDPPTGSPGEVTEMKAADLLRAAARLVARATAQFDLRAHACTCCGAPRTVNRADYHAHRAVSGMPVRLVRVADGLEGKGAPETAQED